MNSVSNLMKVSFRSLPYEQKLRILRLGPHKPNIEIKQLVNKGQGKRSHRYFHKVWYDKVSWLCGCSRTNSLFCFPCLLYGGESTWTKIGVTDIKHLSDKVKLHETSKAHVSSMALLESELQSMQLKTEDDEEFWVSIVCYGYMCILVG